VKRLYPVLLCALLGLVAPAVAGLAQADARNGLRVSANHRYLVDAVNGAPVFLLADTAWNLGALKPQEIDVYLESRAAHGFNTIMFALNFAPQADEKNAEGEPAYLGADKTELNPAYFTTCDAIVRRAAEHGLYVMPYAMWAGEKAGTMNRYTAGQLATLGRALGGHFKGVPNVILCAGGEASPHYIEPERVNALGLALKAGCEGENLVTVHPVSGNSTSKFYATSPWLDFFMSQAKSSGAPASVLYDAAALVLGDFTVTPTKPTMMAEHRYESGTQEDPLIQRRSLYQCVFAGGCGYAYGHNALWQMTPHTAQPWMLKGWNPGVENWTQALDTPAVRQLHHIKALLFSHPYLERIPDQSLVLAGQGADVATRVQATRDGTPGRNDATYLMAYVSAPQAIPLNTGVIAARELKAYWFDPATGASETIHERFANPGSLMLEKRAQGGDAVIVIEDAATNYAGPSGDAAWRPLLDEKLSAWESWMGSPHQSVEGLPAGTAKSANGRGSPPMGLGNDPKNVFTVRVEAGEPVLHVTGEIWGGLTTRESFSNYHLRLEVKWGERKWEPRLAQPRNSGLLYHGTGLHGAFWNTWKRSLEFEIQEDDMGDLYPLGGARGDVVLLKQPSKVWIADAAGELTTVGAGVKEAGGNRAAHRRGEFERPHGEWNTLELYTIGRTAVHVVNGQVVNVVRNTAVLDGTAGAVAPLEGGQLQLQSESAEVFFRRIEIRPLAEFPAEIKRAAGLTDAEKVAVPRWEPHDFAFTSAAVPENPFQISFSAEVTGPNGAKLTVPGFFDGDGTWKVRVSAPAEGAWSFVTRSDLAELDGRRGSFTCVANPSPAVHGSVRIDAERPHQFVYEDGTRFLPVGYECDWLWALDAGDPELKTINPFLDKLAAHGFNFVILNAYAHDTKWRAGRTGDDDFGPPPLYAWAGTNEQPDHRRFNLAFWQHYDRVIEALHRRGMWAHVLMKVYNKQVNWPANGSAEDDRYFRWLIARYAAYPNLTWDLAKEAHYEKDLDYKLGRLRFIRANDPYRRLLTVHDDRANYDRGAYDGLADYRSDQQHKDWREVMQAHLAQRAWPVINTEFGYEHGPGGLADKTYNVAQSPEEVIRRAWEVYTAGGFGAHYYTHTAWDVVRVNDTPPGYAYFKHLRDFFAQTAYWRMQPADGVSSAGSCLAEPGREYVVFLGAAAPCTLKIEGATAPLAVEWYRPLTGERRAAGTVENGRAALAPPADWSSGPVALHVGDACR